MPPKPNITATNDRGFGPGNWQGLTLPSWASLRARADQNSGKLNVISYRTDTPRDEGFSDRNLFSTPKSPVGDTESLVAVAEGSSPNVLAHELGHVYGMEDSGVPVIEANKVRLNEWRGKDLTKTNPITSRRLYDRSSEISDAILQAMRKSRENFYRQYYLEGDLKNYEAGVGKVEPYTGRTLDRAEEQSAILSSTGEMPVTRMSYDDEAGMRKGFLAERSTSSLADKVKKFSRRAVEPGKEGDYRRRQQSSEDYHQMRWMTSAGGPMSSEASPNRSEEFEWE